ncbi:MAG TPA: response regulator [Elusimicrobiota bacterium]|nr:response regulator [Elusimicrobiota bacterium]
MEKKETFTTYEISQFCNVFVTTVANWIDEGKLSAYRTPGGHRRVLRQDLLAFLEKYKMPIPEILLEVREKKLLIVDDNPQTLDMLQQALLKQNPGYLIRMVGNGFDAGKEVAVFRPHLIILDIVLPGLDGLQVFQNLKKDPLTRNIHVIAITGHDEPSIREEFVKLGVDDYMEKPLNLERLTQRVKEILEKAAPLGPGNVAKPSPSSNEAV